MYGEFDIHVVYQVTVFFLEQHPFGYGAEGFVVKELKTVARDLEREVQGVEPEVHQRVKLGGQGHVRIHYAPHFAQQRKQGVDLWHHVEHRTQIEPLDPDCGSQRKSVGCRR